jgi:hypothetical protein
MADELSVKQLRQRLAALMDYQGRLYQINEQSDAADREEMRVIIAISKINSKLREMAARTTEGAGDEP